MKVMGIHIGLQNYGINIGKKALYIYFYRCNRKCLYCNIRNDFFSLTKKEDFPDFTIDELIFIVEEYNIKDIVLTGGEPTTIDDIIVLVDELHKRGYNVALETNAKKYHKVYEKVDEVIINIKTYSAGVPYTQRNMVEKIEENCKHLTLTCLIKDIKDFDTLLRFKDYDVWCFLEFDDTDYSKYVYQFLLNPNWRMIIRYDRIFGVDLENSYRRLKNNEN